MNTFLHTLNRAARRKHKRDRIIKKASKNQLNAVRNICVNLCRNKFQLDERQRRKLSTFRKDIRDLASPHKLKSTNSLRKRLVQCGGFLPILLPAILGLLSTVGSKVLERAIGV
jgi:hypothetical protein